MGGIEDVLKDSCGLVNDLYLYTRDRMDYVVVVFVKNCEKYVQG